MSTTDERDEEVLKIASKLFDDATSQEDFELDTVTEGKLKAIVSASSRGLREVLLTAVIAKLYDPSFDPTSKFYECNPRSIYEGPIRQLLVDNKIPRGKSGPLNVAKAAPGLNAAWAAQRRPKGAALAVKEMAEYINSLGKDELTKFGVRLVTLLMKESAKTSTYGHTNPAAVRDAGKKAEASIMLIKEAPDRGNTPQKVCGMILDAYFRSLGSKVYVDGLKDEACVTNTTSKKPADLCETTPDGKVLKAYEVSVKIVDDNRIADSWEAVMKFNSDTGSSISEVTFLCRPEDLPDEVKRSLSNENSMLLGELEENGVLYRFISLFPWIRFMLTAVLNHEAREMFQTSLDEYVGDVNTRAKVKTSWDRILDGVR